MADRRINYVPQKYPALRKVQPYADLVNDAFERCIELYLCPRILRKKLRMDPNALIPKLPDPQDLKPFPTFEALIYTGHKAKVVAISVDPTGLYLASGDESGALIVWNVYTARIMKNYAFEEPIHDVQWNKNKDLQLIAVALDSNQVILVNPGLAPKEQSRSTDQLLAGYANAHKMDLATSAAAEEQPEEKEDGKKKKKERPKKAKKQIKTDWVYIDQNSEDYVIKGRRVAIKLEYVPLKLVWHAKGDYFATVGAHTETSKQVLVHSLSKSRSQVPFAKSKGIIECVEFHPDKPLFFVATRRSVFVYNLQKQLLVKKFSSTSQWISSIAIHPKGDNFIVGTYDKRVIWFDMDMGSKPYKVLKYGDKAVRKVDFHPKYPLFASASDDGSVYVFHGMVYDDLLQNAAVVPLKILQGHKVLKDLGTIERG